MQKIMICITEDWFALSHFKPLIRAIKEISNNVVVVANDTGCSSELEKLGVRVVNFDFQRSSLTPIRTSGVIWKLSRLLKQEQPDILHLVAMKPAFVGASAITLSPVPYTVVHMTGLGHLAISQSKTIGAVRKGVFSLIARALRPPQSWLMVENTDDLDFLNKGGVIANNRTTILAGAGINPAHFPATPLPNNDPPVVAFVGRMIETKGVHILIDAHRELAHSDTPFALHLYGSADKGNPTPLKEEMLQVLNTSALIHWHGATNDVRKVWAKADICVHPAISREGMPRAMLEAASSARPLIVTDVPGCRHFVTSGVEGLVIPPNNREALVEALITLLKNPELRQKMGNAARAKLVNEFTDVHVCKAIKSSYLKMLECEPHSRAQGK